MMKTTTTIARKKTAPKATTTGTDTPEVVAAITRLAAAPAPELPATFCRANRDKLAKLVCAKLNYKPKKFPAVDPRRDEILRGFLLVSVFPETGLGGVLQTPIQPQSPELKQAWGICMAKFWGRVAERFPELML